VTPLVPADAPGALAIGWATVELERAARELAHLLALGGTFGAAPGSIILGSRCWVGPAADRADLHIVLLEPDTEGRLARTLARSGEGWVASWELVPTGGGARSEAGPRLSAARSGPFGPERLVLGGPLAGPHRLFVEAVPSRP
jgi:hypothetical protein